MYAAGNLLACAGVGVNPTEYAASHLRMADLFLSCDAVKLLRGKKLCFIGDSNMRALYKDLICLLGQNRLLTEKELKGKGETSVLGDTLLRGSPLTKGRDYKEDRRFRDRSKDLYVNFQFVTRCLNDDIEDFLKCVRNRRTSPPDILVMNSTMWDINRWGFDGVEKFKDNLNTLMKLFQSSLPPSTLVIWTTAPPLAVEIKGGFIIKQIEFAKYAMRFHVMEANMFAQQTVRQYGYNVLDFHFHLRMQVHWRRPDGLHWTQKAMRHLTNLLLTHIALALNVPLPGNLWSSLLEKHRALVDEVDADPGDDFELPTVPRGLLPTPAAPRKGAVGEGQSRGRFGEDSSRRDRDRNRWRAAGTTGPPSNILQGRAPRGQGQSRWTGAPVAPPSVQSFTEEDIHAAADSNTKENEPLPQNQPQQIQSLWGPVKRNHHFLGQHRRRPY